jgi:hypothetical protein
VVVDDGDGSGVEELGFVDREHLSVRIYQGEDFGALLDGYGVDADGVVCAHGVESLVAIIESARLIRCWSSSVLPEYIEPLITVIEPRCSLVWAGALILRRGRGRHVRRLMVYPGSC